MVESSPGIKQEQISPIKIGLPVPEVPKPKIPEINDNKKLPQQQIAPEKLVVQTSVAKPKKINNKIAELTHETARNLEECGLNSDYVNGKPIGEGANHVVFLYQPPGEKEQVIKIPKTKSLTTLNYGMSEEDSNIEIINKVFPGFTLSTEIKKSGKSEFYCIVQDRVTGQPVSNKNYQGEVKKQLEAIVALNYKLMQETGLSLDFIGMPGFWSWLKRQFFKFITQKSEFEISNILINEKDGKLYIIDYDFLQMRGKCSLKKKIISKIGFFFNRLLMKHYFHLDISHKK